MARLFYKASFCRTTILLWLLVGFAGPGLNAPRAISATALAWPLQTRTPSAGAGVSGTDQGLQPNQESQQIPLSEKQKRDLMKSNFDKMKRDAKELADLAKALQDELDKSNENILSLNVVGKADKIEKLARRIKGTARGF
jgi:hypothetical protein